MNFLAILFNKPNIEHPRPWVLSIVIAMTVLTLWTISLLTVGFIFPVYLLAMGIVSLIIFLSPTSGLPVILLATMWFQKWFTLEPVVLADVSYKLYPLDVIFVVTILSLLFHRAFGKDSRKFHRFTKIDYTLIIFILLCIVYFIGAIVLGADLALAVSSAKNYAFYALLFFLVTYTVQHLDEVKDLFKVLLTGGFGIITFVVIGILRGQGLWTEFNPLSTEGVRLLSFPHAFYLSVAMIVTLVLYLYHLRPERVTLLTMWIQFFGVIGSLMRHLWLALFLTTAFLFVVVPRKVRSLLATFLAKNLALVLLFGSFIVFLLFVFPFSSTAFQLQAISDPVYNRARSLAASAADSSARWRFFAWRAAKDSSLDHPIFGVGYGTQLTIDFDTYRVTIPIRDLHNSLLVLLVQMGIIGLAVFLYLLWIVTKQVYDSWRARGIFWPYQIALFSALVLFLLASFTQPYFETNFTGIFFWIVLGWLVSALRLDENEAAILAYREE